MPIGGFVTGTRVGKRHISDRKIGDIYITKFEIFI